MSKVVLITGVSGMDGSLMADYLLRNTDYKIYGMARYSASPNYANLEEAMSNERFHLLSGDLTDEVSINAIVKTHQPDYFINLAAHSFVGDSWDQPMKVFDVNALGVIRCLEAIRNHKPDCRFYNAGTSEEFGDVVYSPQDEKHPLRPRSPYGAAKAAARHAVKVWRDSYDLYAVQGWLFNHEGTRRGDKFVTRKITKEVARIRKALNAGEAFEPLVLGNLEAKRDWSDAEDFIRGIWLMLNQENTPRMKGMCLPYKITDEGLGEVNFAKCGYLIEEYVLASGYTHTIREFVEIAFEQLGIPLLDSNKDRLKPAKDEKGHQLNYTLLDGTPAVVVSREFYRPAEVELLKGSPERAMEELGWQPKTTFFNLVKKMVENDDNV